MELPVLPEDQEKNRLSIESAKKIFPNHDSVVLMEADQLSNDGDITGAISLLDRYDENSTDITPLIIKASILTAKAFIEMQSATSQEMFMNAQKIFSDVQNLYEKALMLEPLAIEVMAQYAQLKSMLQGDLKGASELLNRALPLSRTRDEVLEISQLLLMNEAQLKAVEEMQKLSFR